MVMESARSGMRAACVQIDVISNNLGNVETVGFKRARSIFGDVYSAMNTSMDEIGHGVNTLMIDQDFTQGALFRTENPYDFAIDGHGFFMVGRTDGLTSYTRAGVFKINSDGDITDTFGNNLQGYPVTDITSGTLGSLGSLTEPPAVLPASPSTEINMRNLQLPISGQSFTTTATAIDENGLSQNISLIFSKDEASSNTWNISYLFQGESIENEVADTSLTFNINGQLAESVAFSLPVGSNTVQVNIPASSTTTGASGLYPSVTSDGYLEGELSLNSISIDTSGIMRASYSNGETRTFGQIVIANFSNPKGLKPIGDSQFLATTVSGSAIKNTPGINGLGVVQAGYLEESNTDITEELISLIVAQRNFQANAQSIKTYDTITQVLNNIRS